LNLGAQKDQPAYRECKVEGRSRIRAWTARRREQLALQQEVGLEEFEDRAEQARCVRDDIEDVIWETPARSIEGVAVKLRIYITRDGEIDEEAQTGHKRTDTLRKYIRLGSLFRENAAGQVGL
jgi:hypothetical protein